MSTPEPAPTRLCPHCGADLPPSNPRFCIDCGGALDPNGAEEPPAIAIPATTGPTVRLGNARVEQSVIGGTIRLASSGAIPPGLWFQDALPGPEDIVAVYAPLRAVVGGWSGLVGAKWQRSKTAPSAIGTRTLFRFEAEQVWFPASGYGQGLKLHVRILAQSEADEGRSRRGFRYRAHYDPPMEVDESWWADDAGRRVERAAPQIQLMAPPRIPRVSDYNEAIRWMPAANAEAWARAGQLPGRFQLLNTAQQRTPAGRGLPLADLSARWLPLRLLSRPAQTWCVQALHPLICRLSEWPALEQRIRREARGLGLDMGTDLEVEWWLDRQGHDCVVLEDARRLYGHQRVAIAFRRAQVVACEPG